MHQGMRLGGRTRCRTCQTRSPARPQPVSTLLGKLGRGRLQAFACARILSIEGISRWACSRPEATTTNAQQRAWGTHEAVKRLLHSLGTHLQEESPHDSIKCSDDKRLAVPIFEAVFLFSSYGVCPSALSGTGSAISVSISVGLCSSIRISGDLV